MPDSHIVGVWYVRIVGAPFEQHLLTFHTDGTLLQANPDAGDAQTSDSVGMGIWRANGSSFIAKFVETTADRATHSFVSRGEISLSLLVAGDTLTGQARTIFYDAKDVQITSSAHDITGQRITL